ncbi:hypothetical protein IAD21_01357 [Abditibacteriota bacterium]|nr:hypothetical protein IAD21_01357 [Abditibacteriota bacterium]
MPLDEIAIASYISERFADVHVLTAHGNYFFYYGPFEGVENKFPFATLVTNDEYDQASDLSRPGVFRLNVGVRKETYLSLFGSKAPRAGESGITETGYDYTALDTIMPHPIYGPMYWLSVLNPGEETFEKVRSLLAEAYEMDVRKQEKRGKT